MKYFTRQFMPYCYKKFKTLTSTYCPNIDIILCSNFFAKAFTKSQAARLRVSTSLPSMSRLMYSSGLSSNNSSSLAMKKNKIYSLLINT